MNTNPETSRQPVAEGTGIPADRLSRALELILLLTVAATALAYPLCLSEKSLQAAYAWFTNKAVFRQIEPWITCGFSPLVLKEALLMTLTGASGFVWVWLKVRGQWLGVEKSALGATPWRGWRNVVGRPGLWLTAFVLYAGATVSWSPVFNSSIHTLTLMGCGLALMLLVKSLAWRRDFMVRFMMLVVACGFVLALVALLQHLGLAAWLPRAADPRNRMASLIGHNTGLSSWLMFPLSYAAYFGMQNRRWWVRAGCWLLVALIAFVIIAAESRAIWVLALAVGLIVPWQIARRQRRRFSVTTILTGLAVLLALVLALVISPERNPLARLPMSLKERVTGHVFNLDQLRRETRLRIVTVSLAELVPQAPLRGYGLNSFAWEYPKAQGDYFAKHPDSRLGTTTRRTDLAHNDYLQVLVETGLAGLALLLGALATVALESLRRYRKLVASWDQAAWWALAAPVVAVAIHALVDFPLHVAPIALVTLYSTAFALRSSEQRIDVATQDDIAGTDAAGPDGAHLAPGSFDQKALRRASAVGAAAAVVLFSWTPWAWQALVGRPLLSDIYFNNGQGWLDRYYGAHGQTFERKAAFLERARGAFRAAVVADVFNGEAYEGQATALVNRAALGLGVYQQLDGAERETTRGLFLRESVRRDADTAISITENQLHSGGLRYHFTWYLLGRAYRMQWELEEDKSAPQETESYQHAVAAQRKALYYNPADAASLRELSDLLSAVPATAAEGRSLLNQLFKIDPRAAAALILEPALELASWGEVITARDMLEPTFRDLPEHPEVLLARAWLAYYTAVWPPRELDTLEREADYHQWRREHLEPAVPVLAAVPEEKPYKASKERLEMLYAGAMGDIPQAHMLAKKKLTSHSNDPEARAIFNWSDQALFGGGLRYENTVEYYRTKALLNLYFMGRREEGLALGELALREELTLPEARRVAAMCEANQWWDFLKKTLPAIRKPFPGDPALKELAARLQAH